MQQNQSPMTMSEFDAVSVSPFDLSSPRKCPGYRMTLYEVMEVLVFTFKDMRPVSGRVVGEYVTGLFLAKPRIVIECDDDEHEAEYDYAKEIERMVKITNALNCRWVRFNRNKSGFNVGMVAHDVLTLILASSP